MKMKNKFIKFAAVIILLCALAAFIGCGKEEKNSKFPFDAEKAYLYKRPGLISGASFSASLEKKGIVEVYSYVIPAPEYEDGMKDLGADIYFVGISPGEVLVTFIEYSPVDDPIESFMTLCVDENLCVFQKEAE